jgi:DNA-binding PadR family transcriptional regulator
MDIPREGEYLPWHVQRKKRRYGIARRIEQVSQQVLQLNEGTVYTSLLRLQQRGWIASDWGTSENNRKAKYYSITKSGRKQLARETADTRTGPHNSKLSESSPISKLTICTSPSMQRYTS